MVNLPNTISIIRILLIPVFLYFLFNPGFLYLALTVLILAAFSDWLDGYLARSTNKISRIGTILDPMADRLLIISVISAIYIKFQFPELILIIILLVREVLMVVGGLILMRLGKNIQVIMTGKISTALLFISFIFVFFSKSAATLIFYAGFILSLIAGWMYFQSTFRDIFAHKRS